ncbi:hypothetical protein TELCIR_12252, partial [Teladorsagia circumcincta]
MLARDVSKRFSQSRMCCTILLCILAVICPPVAVLLDQGCTNQFWINILLTILVWIPGVIHAFW